MCCVVSNKLANSKNQQKKDQKDTKQWIKNQQHEKLLLLIWTFDYIYKAIIIIIICL